VSEVTLFAAFSNGFWVFIGIVAGALIQYSLNWIGQQNQRKNAKRVFRVETAINRDALDALSETLRRKKERFIAGQKTDQDFFIDMSAFNYRIVDPLINAGYFHDLLGSIGVQRYFRYAGELNTGNAQNLMSLLRQEDEAGRSLSLLDWIIDTKLSEWNGHLAYVEERIGDGKKLPRIEYQGSKQITQ